MANKSNNPKREHHVLPELYLKGFIIKGDEPFIWAFRCAAPCLRLRPRRASAKAPADWRSPRRFAPFGRRRSARQRLGLRQPPAAFPRIPWCCAGGGRRFSPRLDQPELAMAVVHDGLAGRGEEVLGDLVELAASA